METKHSNIALWILCMLTTVSAEEVDWKTVGVSWVLSLVTTVVIMGLSLAVLRYRRKKKKKNNIVTPPYRRDLSVLSDATRVSHMSEAPLVGGYERVSTKEPINRRKSDFISQWCSQHGLAEVIATNLRENGFNSRAQIDSLRPKDVVTLGLPNVAQQVQLRNVLELIQREQEVNVSVSVGADVTDGPRETSVGRISTGTSQARSRSASHDKARSRSSDESGGISTPSPVQMSPSGATSHFPYSISPVHVSEETRIGRIPLKSAHSNGNRLSFHGILSDHGLYELAELLGSEWRHLAAILTVPKPQVDHFVSDHPGNTKQHICETIRYWRDYIAKGEKEQVKAELANALKKIKRRDLADALLREQVHGSDPNLHGTHRMNSVV